MVEAEGGVPFSSGVSVAVLEAAGGSRRAVGGENRQLAVGRVGVALDQGSGRVAEPDNRKRPPEPL